jgi:hypothetical protein
MLLNGKEARNKIYYVNSKIELKQKILASFSMGNTSKFNFETLVIFYVYLASIKRVVVELSGSSVWSPVFYA